MRAGRRLVRRRCSGLCAGLLVLLAASPASAQPSRAQRDRVAVAALIGTSGADATTIECCGLRTPPHLEMLDGPPRLLLAGGGVRVFWTPRTATFLEIQRSATQTWQFTFSRPLADPFPFAFYEAQRTVRYRSTTWMFGQTAELRTRGRVRPWIFGGAALRQTSERQDELHIGFLNPSARVEQMYQWHRRQWTLVTGAAARTHLTRRLFVSGEVAWAFRGRQVCTDCVMPRDEATLDRTFPDYVTFRAGVGMVF